MNRTQLTDRITARTGLSQKKAGDVLDVALDEIVRAVVDGDRVSVTGFGAFFPVQRAARTARDPRRGVALEVPERRAVTFEVSPSFARYVADPATTPDRPYVLGRRATPTTPTTA